MPQQGKTQTFKKNENDDDDHGMIHGNRKDPRDAHAQESSKKTGKKQTKAEEAACHEVAIPAMQEPLTRKENSSSNESVSRIVLFKAF